MFGEVFFVTRFVNVIGSDLLLSKILLKKPPFGNVFTRLSGYIETKPVFNSMPDATFGPPSSWNLLSIKSVRMLLLHKSAGTESEGPGRTHLTGNWLHSLENTSRSRPHRWQRAILQKKKKEITPENVFFFFFFFFLGFQCQEFLGSYAFMWLAKHYRHKAN